MNGEDRIATHGVVAVAGVGEKSRKSRPARRADPAREGQDARALRPRDAGVRGASKLNAVLRAQWADALLFRRIATVELDAPVSASVDELRWTGPADSAALVDLCGPDIARRAEGLAERRR